MIVDTPLSAYLADPTEFNRDALVAAHYGMCRRGARKFRRAGTDLADLEQVAVLGLLKAIRYFRTELQTPFEAYAWIMVVGELMHCPRLRAFGPITAPDSLTRARASCGLRTTRGEPGPIPVLRRACNPSRFAAARTRRDSPAGGRRHVTRRRDGPRRHAETRR